MHDLTPVARYFPDLPADRLPLLAQYADLLTAWNARVNLVSRKDVEHLVERHLLHALCLTRFVAFRPGARLVDVGTGGGLPGLPVAIFFPEAEVTLLDSIAKKAAAVADMVACLELPNVRVVHARAEAHFDRYDFVLGRAVTRLADFYAQTRHLLHARSQHDLPNGVLYLKGGDDDLNALPVPARVLPLHEIIDLPWYETKNLVYLEHCTRPVSWKNTTASDSR